MPLSAGTRLGPYEIVSALGAGGMGEVYQARDTRLKRDVALKVLPDTFAKDTDRLARFQREAELLATLNHPHIAGIYGLEESHGVRALVLELVEGPTLADRMARGPIPLDDALPIARQIAEALEAAHEQGIIHRDLKPANIKVRPDGTVKVLDFGLAKLADPAGTAQQAGPNVNVTASPTITSPAMMTGVGVILGTAAYMSPEQAKGRPADTRSDIWAFGSVLFEMLTGKRAFEGEDVSDTLAAVLRGEPDWASLPREVPAAVRTLLRRCLERDPRKRVADISTARYVLEDPSMGAPTRDVAASAVAPRPLWRRAAPTAIGMIAAATLAAGLVSMRVRPAPVPPAIARFQIATEGPALSGFGAISPDGSKIVYGLDQLYVRSLSERAARPIAGTARPNAFVSGTARPNAFIYNPVFAPDGHSIVFWSGVPGPTISGELRKVAVDGGPVVTLAPAGLPYGMSWGADGIVYGQVLLKDGGIFRVSPNGGQPEQLVTDGPGELAIEPQMLPGQDALLFTYASGLRGAPPSVTTWDKARIVVQSLRTGARTTVVDGGSAARYVSSGHLVYAVGGTLMAVAFDAKHRQTTGAAVPVVESVVRPVIGTFAPGAALFSVSDTGSLIYTEGDRGGPAQAGPGRGLLATMNRTGDLAPLKLPEAAYESPRVSPDGKRLAYDTDDGREAIVWVYELSGTASPRRLTFVGRNRYPIWTPDGQRLTFASDRDGDAGIFWQRADGSGTAERLTKSGPTPHVPLAWSPRGDVLLFATAGQLSLQTLSLADRKVAPFKNLNVQNVVLVPQASFSPDGRWVAYSVPVNEAPMVFVEPFPATGAKYQVSSEPATNPLWSRDGREIFYSMFTKFSSVKVMTAPAVSFTDPTTIDWRRDPGVSFMEERNYDILPDGQRFIRIVSVADQPQSGSPLLPPIQVVLNWSEELKRRVPTK